jgi:hypothetical protein
MEGSGSGLILNFVKKFALTEESKKRPVCIDGVRKEI